MKCVGAVLLFVLIEFLMCEGKQNTDCNRRIKVTSPIIGFINSPNYPNEYPANSECTYRITSTGTFRVSISFVDFHLEESPNCNNDYVAVYDGSSTTDRLLGQDCGTVIPPSHTSSERDMTVLFKSNSAYESSGFRIKYDTVSMSAYRNCDVSVEVGANTNDDLIKSPNYPKEYPANSECTYRITSSSSAFGISISFVAFCLEDSTKCNNDYLAVHDGKRTSSGLLGKHCGCKIPLSHSSSGRYMTIFFKSDASVQRSGFSIKYRAVPASTQRNCNQNIGVVPTSNGTIDSPNFKPPYSASSDCTYILETKSEAYFVTIIFATFSLQDHPNCGTEYLAVYDGSTTDTKLLGKHCGASIPPIYTSSGRYMTIYFKHSSNYDTNQQVSSFKLRYIAETAESANQRKRTAGTESPPTSNTNPGIIFAAVFTTVVLVCGAIAVFVKCYTKGYFKRFTSNPKREEDVQEPMAISEPQPAACVINRANEPIIGYQDHNRAEEIEVPMPMPISQPLHDARIEDRSNAHPTRCIQNPNIAEVIQGPMEDHDEIYSYIDNRVFTYPTTAQSGGARQEHQAENSGNLQNVTTGGEVYIDFNV